MPIAVANINTLAAKYSANAQNAVAAYKAGVQSPRRSQSATAIAAAQTWAQAVQTAATNGTYAKGLTKAGDAKWSANALNLGAQRYGPGVANAQGAWAACETPYLQAIANLTLPPRGVTGSPQNIARVQAVDTALQQVKAQSAA